MQYNYIKNVALSGLLAAFCTSAQAEIVPTEATEIGVNEEVTQAEPKSQSLFPTPKLGGTFVGRYTYTDSETSENGGGGFDLRFARLKVEGSALGQFKYRLQAEICGTPGSNKGARVVDAYLEWVKYKEFQIKAGQFKRAFIFENPYALLETGFGSLSQVNTKFAGFGDRVGEQTVNGRDIGIQFQGDLFPAKNDSFRYLHYQVGIYNGQGTNMADRDKKKDIIGTIQVQPIKDLYIGVFGWKGNYVGSERNAAGELPSVDRIRYDIGFKYESDWTFRGEYVHSTGRKISGSEIVGANQADGWYLVVGAPVAKKVKIYGKWDVYRDDATMDTRSSIYALSANWRLHKNLLLQLQYNYCDNLTSKDRYYNQLFAEFYVNF